MNNIETGVIETIGDFAPIVGEDTQFPWTEFGKKRVDGRTENNQLQEFGFAHSSVGNGNVAFGLNCNVKLNSRQARTEINVDGKYLGNTSGLQWYLIRADYNTKDRVASSNYGGANYQYHRGITTNGDIWDNDTAYTQRKDFKNGKRFYLLGLDPAHVYANQCYRERGYHGSNWITSWGFVTSISLKHSLITPSKTYALKNSEDSGRLVLFVSKLEGLDFIQGSKIWNEDVEATHWITNKLNRDIAEWTLKKRHKATTHILEYDKPQVLYSRQFKGAGASEETVRVGHLRFRRVADANLQKTGTTVIDLIEWYGIIPILNVPKTVSFACVPEYFKHHTNSMCMLCNQDNLELQSGRYVIDVDSECLYFKNDYRYKHSKKAWILSSLANMRVAIENDTIDRIIPIAEEGLNLNTLIVEDDDFLNRF